MAQSTQTIAVIDYGMGNLHSVAKALQHADRDEKANIIVTHQLNDIKNADKVLLPGVGAMRDCMGEMQALDLIETIKESAANKPFLGICIGMQALLSHSDENDGVACLDIFKGNVVHFSDGLKENNLNLKIPHMGWNTVQQKTSHPMWTDIQNDEYFYFVHSYYALPDNVDEVVATSNYGEQFTVAIAKDNIFATQFHPEKSADAGVQLYANFINWNGGL